MQRRAKRSYKVLADVTPELLSDLVDIEIQKGLHWVPQGGMFMVNDYGLRYYQAMYRKLPKRLEKEI